MNSPMKSQHWYDNNGKPAGGCTYGTGFCISWQNGPLGRGVDRVDANGAFVEDLLKAAADRLMFYQNGEFACEDNAQALEHLFLALQCLDNRTKRREAQGVEGTHDK